MKITIGIDKKVSKVEINVEHIKEAYRITIKGIAILFFFTSVIIGSIYFATIEILTTPLLWIGGVGQFLRDLVGAYGEAIDEFAKNWIYKKD